MEFERFLTPSELAAASGLSVRSLSDAARSGKLISYKAHGKRLFKWADFEDYMKQFRSKPEREPSPMEFDAAAHFRRQQERRELRKRRSKE